MERRIHPLLPRKRFMARLARFVVLGVVLVAVSLAIGMIGYHWLESLDWLDAFLNAAMLLSGEGPLSPPRTAAGKVFAGFYSLFSGFVVIVAAGIVFTPLVHRMLHRFHLEKDERS